MTEESSLKRLSGVATSELLLRVRDTGKMVFNLSSAELAESVGNSVDEIPGLCSQVDNCSVTVVAGQKKKKVEETKDEDKES